VYEWGGKESEIGVYIEYIQKDSVAVDAGLGVQAQFFSETKIRLGERRGERHEFKLMKEEICRVSSVLVVGRAAAERMNGMEGTRETRGGF